MGNTASNTNNSPRPSGLQNRSLPSPHRTSKSRPSSPASSSNPASSVPHKSLRHKKKSLELPDLASLGLSPVTSPSGPYSRRNSGHPYTSSPIPIPATPQPLPNPYANPQPGRGRNRDKFDSRLEISEEPSTHVPIYPINDTSKRSSRGNPFIRGAPIQYTSTRSFHQNGSQSSSQRMREVPPSVASSSPHSHTAFPVNLGGNRLSSLISSTIFPG